MMIDEYCNHGYPATKHCYPTATVTGLNYSHQCEFTKTVHKVRDQCTYIKSRHGLAEQFLTGGLAMYCQLPRPQTD